jgi:acylphosphatase
VSDPAPLQPARERLDASVHGHVQGVGFRVFALREAMDLGVAGWVANEADGSVHVVAEGPRHDLETLLARLEAGPPAAIVDRVAARWEPARGAATGFRIESRAHRGD